MKKNLRKRIMAFGLLVFLMLVLTACGKKEKQEETLTEENVTDTETDDGSTKQAEEIEYAYDIPTLLSDLKINGVSIKWDSNLGDIREIFHVYAPRGYENMPGVLSYDLDVDDKDVGIVYVKENMENEDRQEILGITLYGFERYDFLSFEFSGVTESSKRSEVVETLGQPSTSNDSRISYLNELPNDSQVYTYDEISLFYNVHNDEEILSSITIIYSKMKI